ncbi:MAG: RDD family protein [Caldimonas sp.]
MPSLPRRMAAFVYESMLLFGVSLIPAVVATLFFAQTGRRHLLQGDTAIRLFALAVYGVYFVWFWSARGQTLAMQTWRIRLATAAGGRVSPARALVRYVACCLLWLALPAFVATGAGLAPWPALALVAAWIAAYGLLSLAAPGRQFWHDRLCGTRLIDERQTGETPTQPTARPR